MPAAIAGEEKYPYPASGLEKAIGYTFRNQELLLNALRHSSYSNETKKMQNASNERLEFLGDSVLSVIVSDYLSELRRSRRGRPDQDPRLRRLRKFACRAGRPP